MAAAEAGTIALGTGAAKAAATWDPIRAWRVGRTAKVRAASLVAAALRESDPRAGVVKGRRESGGRVTVVKFVGSGKAPCMLPSLAAGARRSSRRSPSRGRRRRRPTPTRKLRALHTDDVLGCIYLARRLPAVLGEGAALTRLWSTRPVARYAVEHYRHQWVHNCRKSRRRSRAARAR